MKKWLALLLCALLCQSALAAASEEVQEDAYAREIVALLEDKTCTGIIKLTQDVSLEEISPYGGSIRGPEEEEKVLDLNGHTMTLKEITNNACLRLVDSAGGGALILTKGSIRNYSGTLILDGAAVVGQGSGEAILNPCSGTLYVMSGSVTSQFAVRNEGGNCIISGGSICSNGTAVMSYPGYELYPVQSYDIHGKAIAGSTGTSFYDGTITISGGVIDGEEAAIDAQDTNVTITGGIIRGQIVTERSNEYKNGRPIRLESPQKMQYYNSAGEAVTLPSPTYELYEEGDEMWLGYWDIKPQDWFYQPSVTLLNQGVLGYGQDGNFSPTEPLTRGQAAALLARTCGVETQEEWDAPVFLDVAEATPYAKYINAGQKAGLLSGDGKGQFHPESTITRQEFAVLVMNAVHKCGLELSPESQSVSFRDEDAIALWAKDAVAEGASYGLWNGTDSGDFLPLNPITRAEGVAILARIPELPIMIGL